LTLRRTPGGEAITTIPEGTALATTGEEERVGDRQWRQVRDPEGRNGWVAAEFVAAEARTPTPSPVPPPTATSAPTTTPTWPVPLLPTITLGPAEAASARTRPPRESPAAVETVQATPTGRPSIVVQPTAATPTTMPATRQVTATPPARSAPTGQASKPTTGGNCHASYPDFCMPPPPPDLDCNSAALGGRRRFAVRPPDPHGLDADRDGIGCE
jgi:hypothetical protein